MAEITISLPRLHAGQLRIRDSIEREKVRFAVTMCGRQWGKSTDGLEWIAEGAIGKQPCAWFAPTFKYLAPVWRELCQRLKPIARSVNEQEKRLELITGGVIECWSLDTPDAGRGRHYARVVIDEAGIVRDLLEAWQGAIYATLIRLRGQARFYGTPKGRQHGFVTLFQKGESQEPGWKAYRAATKENPYIPPDEIEEARRNLPPGVFAQEFEGIPADDGGNPFGLDSIRRCVGKLSNLEPVCWGWDFGRAVDYTWGIGLDRRGSVCRSERWQLIPWHETIALVAKHTGGTPAWVDDTGIGDPITDTLQRQGVPVTGVTFTGSRRQAGFGAVTAGTKQKLMERLAMAIQQGTVRFPEGPLVNELESFGYEYTATGVRYTAPSGLHDDGVIALALAVHGRDQMGPISEPVAPYATAEDAETARNWAKRFEKYASHDEGYEPKPMRGRKMVEVDL